MFRKEMFVMYTIHKKTLNNILKNKYKSLIGNLCERIENTFADGEDCKKIENKIKFDVKKDLYNAFHEVEEQINAFSNGTLININMEKPISE
jgi:hypothetical protein